jgi:hypothetical protein
VKYIYSYFELTLNYQNKYPAITHPYSLLYSPDWGLPELLMSSFEKVMEARLSISGEDGKREIVYKGMLQPEAHRGLHVLLITCFSYGKEVPLDNQKDFKSYILCFD